jgi:hypothetical protein
MTLLATNAFEKRKMFLRSQPPNPFEIASLLQDNIPFFSLHHDHKNLNMVLLKDSKIPLAIQDNDIQ